MTFFYVRSITMFTFFAKLVSILIPRFIKEDVAFMLYEKGATPEENTYFPICALDDVDETDEVEMVGVMRSFNLFGFGLFPKLIGELRPYIPQSEIEG
ncbi:hypothetical protein DEEACLCL_00094 [Salmonella phage CRW-SP2]|nr:hypothetical protein DEEACLCL_00094 [Salmonella phage CRW-SP2]